METCETLEAQGGIKKDRLRKEVPQVQLATVGQAMGRGTKA
jgi:hypothetical protein